LTLDPNKFTVTNTFPYSSISNITIDDKTTDQVKIEFESKLYVYKTEFRAQLLCQLLECLAKYAPIKYPTPSPIRAQRLSKNGSTSDCKLAIAPYGIIEINEHNQIVQEYKWVNMSKFGSDPISMSFFFEVTHRVKMFYVEDLDRILGITRSNIKNIGLESTIQFVRGQSIEDLLSHRIAAYNAIPSAVSVFDVNKVTKRSLRPVSRQLHICEDFIVEKDSSGFNCISYQRVSLIYAIIRSWNNPREFAIEYIDGSSRTYTCPERDNLLAMLLDVCHAAGNMRVIVTGEVSDGLRLMPRFAEEKYEASITDSFFGASSIESWYLNRLLKVSRTEPFNVNNIEQACKELNANVACPGIAPSTDINLVKGTLIGIVKSLSITVVNYFAATDDFLAPVDSSCRQICTLLQSLFRIIPCVHGYKSFVEVKEVDTRLLLLSLLRYDHDFVNYWTLQVLTVLCRCPLMPRNIQQEFINRHTLLSDKMLICLVDLMSFRSADPELQIVSPFASDNMMTTSSHKQIQQGTEVPPINQSDAIAIDRGGSPVSIKNPFDEEAKVDNNNSSGSSSSVIPNPSITSHIPEGSTVQVKLGRTLSPDEIAERNARIESLDLINFNPNSLVVIGAAALFESIVTSRRDSSSPELLKQVLDVLADRSEVLINMLKSTSFLIMENASILMFTLIKNRPFVGPLLKELALSECLVLKHFYSAVFSPSSTQRFLSRFLISIWLTGHESGNPAKMLLSRMIPSGLVEYLKFAPITKEHRQNLDSLEEEFYRTYINSSGGSVSTINSSSSLKQTAMNKARSNDMQDRMRTRIMAALRDKPMENGMSFGVPTGAYTPMKQGRSSSYDVNSPMMIASTAAGVDPQHPIGDMTMNNSPLSTSFSPIRFSALTTPVLSSMSSGAKYPENYRIMFHVMTQDHQLPDLIWNEQTRLELRSALESEIKDIEREQKLLGSQKIAWNYQQFTVQYQSLREEIQVGPIYIRYFLEAGETFLKQLENPNPVILFEKLFRRVLVNIETHPELSILCTRCLTRLYVVCKDRIPGGFDDMLIIVRMLEQTNNMELFQSLLDLISNLAAVQSNLLQLLDRDFVKTMIKYATLAHINPDQIGNLLARATCNILMIKDDTALNPTKSTGRYDSPPPPPYLEGDIMQQQQRSLWVPEDICCPRAWLAAPPGGTFPPSKVSQKGPYRVSELIQELQHHSIEHDWLVAPIASDESDDTRFEAIVDTGRWKCVGEYFQLRLQLLSPGKALYSPAEVAVKSLTLLKDLAAVHRSTNSKGIAFYPTPVSKRIMSDSSQLQIFAQLFLSNDPNVVEIAADLLRSLVEFNMTACSKLYLSGVFFFTCRYSGNNFAPLALFLSSTHLKQSFHDSASSVARDLSVSMKSVLGSMLPSAMIYMLHNYGHDKFASIFVGEFDTPEVIWNAELRRYVVEMIEQHLGDFPARLRQFTLAEYEYCPIPKIHFAELEKEIYVHEYYLRNLCDEVRFPDWPIGQPLILLRETIERWRSEMDKGVADSAIVNAKALFELPVKHDSTELRRGYKRLARMYHPDKNSNGREMFEKIQAAYELLSSIELQVNETDMANVVLILRTQIIIYRRFPHKIADQKYPAFKLLMSILDVPPLGEFITGVASDTLIYGTQVMYYTTNISPLNAAEFIKCGALEKLHHIITYALSIVEIIVEEEKEEEEHGKLIGSQLLVYGMKTLTAIVLSENGQMEILKLCPKLAEDMYKVLKLDKIAPIAVENCIEIISRCCALSELQNSFTHAGVIWRLIPFLLAYDNTMKDEYSDESQRAVHNQSAANVHAIVACKALGRLGGYMFDDLQTPRNDSVREVLGTLLTLPLAKLLRNRRPWDLLGALNENVEQTTKIWNVGMRNELLEFVRKVDDERVNGSNDDDLKLAQGFVYDSLKDELCLGGVYVRIFNKTSETRNIDDPSKFCNELIAYIWRRLSTKDSNSNGVESTITSTTSMGMHMVHLDYAVEALRSLTEAHNYIAHDVIKASHGILTIFSALSLPCKSKAFTSAVQALSILTKAAEFIVAVSRYNPPCLWRLLKCLSIVQVDDVSYAWIAAENIATHPEGLDALLQAGAIVRILGTLLAVQGYSSTFKIRLSAIGILSKFLWNPVKGGEASALLRRYNLST